MSIGVIASHAVIGSALSPYAAAVMADNPLGYYRMNEASFGTSPLLDSSGLGHDGTWLNTVSNVPGLITGDTDKAASSNGAVTIAQIPKAAWNELTVITLEAVLQPGANTLMSFWDRDPDIGNRVFQFRMESNGSIGFIYWLNTGGPFSFTSAAGDLASGVKAHVAATYDGTTARIYRNGTQVATNAHSGTLLTGTNARYQIGFNSGNAQRWIGVLDEFALYGTALSAARIAAHAALV